MRRSAGIFVAALLLVPVAAQAMTVDQFLAKANALKAKGMAAMFSPDIGLLKGEVEHASDAYRASLEAEHRAGRPPSSCPPAKGQAHITSNDLLGAFAALPPAQRSMSVNAAFARYMRGRFPCR